MKKNLSRSALACVLASFFLLTAETYAQVVYPKAVGLVNDFAGVLSADKRQELEIKLKDFEKQTTIEIAVVTVESLQGLSVERFTLGLANTWGVGKAGENNGIVFLIAPLERKLRIEVGRGLNQKLTNSMAENIVQSDVLPLFKNKQMEAGVLAGAQSLIRKLESSVPTQPRTMVGAKVAEQAAAQKSASQESPYFLLLVFGGLIVVIGLIFFGVWFKNQAEFRQQVLADLEEEEKRLAIFVGSYPVIEQNLLWLEANQPESVWLDLKKGFQITAAPESFASEFRRLQDGCYGKKHSSLTKESGLLGVFDNKLKKSQARLDKIQTTHAAVKEAIDHGRQMLASLPLKINLVAEAVKQDDVAEKTRGRLTAATAKFAELQTKEVGTLPDQQIYWLPVHVQLDQLFGDLEAILAQAAADRARAERARTEGPELLLKIEQRLADLDEKLTSSKARDKLIQARSRFQQAQGFVPVGGGFDWLQAFLVLETVEGLCNQAETAHQSDSWSSPSRVAVDDNNIGGGGIDFGGGGFSGDSGASGNW